MTEAEIKRKIETYVRDFYDDQWLFAYRAYGGEQHDGLDRKAIAEFLTDAGIPDWQVSLVGRRIMAVADKNGNGRLSLEELQAAIEGK